MIKASRKHRVMATYFRGAKYLRGMAMLFQMRRRRYRRARDIDDGIAFPARRRMVDTYIRR